MRRRRLFSIAACLAGLLPGIAAACTCPASTEYWWQEATRVALVRIESVGWRTEDGFSRATCSIGPRCVSKQVARFTQIESFKGSLNAVPTLASGYGGGDCGIPLVAGAYYVVFLRKDDSNVGICNATGPNVYLKHIEPFLQSLRLVARDPKAKFAARPPRQPL
ncbi:hypothetical protein [Lysobacter sp.]|uniref:hypothetical protein n=1 Tax=Lysobacter sp. TaxID=72226 RepID=UPI002D2F4504|nr:hypothetical protein [Lysobacter sp.]HZX78765.1 hypothetical protein [Lysobacter sp.]